MTELLITLKRIMKLSVVIPCFNEESSIEEIVRCVVNSSYSNKEIIIVDDFSTDQTRSILETNSFITNHVSEIIYHKKIWERVPH